MFAKRLNGGLILTIGLPLFAIFASVGTTIVAFTHGDSTLPGEYHWEGMQLDHDFADARRAFELNVRATLYVTPSAALCRLAVQLDGVPAEALQLRLIHGTRPDLDREVRLSREGSGYEGQCGALPAGHWHLELADETAAWTVRADVFGALDGTTISARPGNGTHNP
jgi:hypothetical protein